MTDVEKQADAIVHAVVAVELLHWHGKLGGTLETAFRKCVYVPVLPRLRRLTSRATSEADYFKVDKNGRKLSRPSRVHDATLERQFTLGNVFTDQALRALNRGHQDLWYQMAQYRSRQELMLSETKGSEDPAAKELVAWSAGHMNVDGTDMTVRDRGVGHGDTQSNIWVLPVFVDHDRSSHAERQAMLIFLSEIDGQGGEDKVTEGVKPEVTGAARIYASHTPCISCLTSMCQFTRAFEGANLKVTFDTWRETRRWIGLEGPDMGPAEEDGEE